jgi:soluble lytic murein transglycosylase-like protein
MISHKKELFFLFVILCFSTISKGEIVKDCDLIRQAKEYGAINPQLVLAISEVESDKNSKIISGRGLHNSHYGLMQLKLETARMLGFRGKPKDLLQWKINLKYGVSYINEKLEKHHSIRAASAAYNAGSVFPCKKRHKGCKIGSFVNQGYVDLVMTHYRKHSKIQCNVG